MSFVIVFNGAPLLRLPLVPPSIPFESKLKDNAEVKTDNNIIRSKSVKCHCVNYAGECSSILLKPCRFNIPVGLGVHRNRLAGS